MARPTSLRSFQAAMTSDDPMRADMDAAGDAESSAQAAVAERDPLTGGYSTGPMSDSAAYAATITNNATGVTVGLDDPQAAAKLADESGVTFAVLGRLSVVAHRDDTLARIIDAVAEAAHGAGLDVTTEAIIGAAEWIWSEFGRPLPSRHTSVAESTVAPAEPTDAAANELPGMPKRPPVKGVLRVPSEGEFGDDEFFVSSALATRARVLIERHPEYFDHLADYSLSVTYLWKKAGGKSKGRGVFGKTTKPAGLLKLFSEAAFVIWLGADHCRGAGYGDREIEALLFHEMLHTGLAEEDEETGRGGGPTLVPHELEIFRAEVEVYGFWADDIRQAAPAFRQGTLFEAPVVMATADAPSEDEEDDEFDPEQADLSDLPDGDEEADEDAPEIEAATPCRLCGIVLPADEMRAFVCHGCGQFICPNHPNRPDGPHAPQAHDVVMAGAV